MKLQFFDDFVKKDFKQTGVWEPRTTEYIKKNLKRGQSFLDIGANVRYFTSILNLATTKGWYKL